MAGLAIQMKPAWRRRDDGRVVGQGLKRAGLSRGCARSQQRNNKKAREGEPKGTGWLQDVPVTTPEKAECDLTARVFREQIENSDLFCHAPFVSHPGLPPSLKIWEPGGQQRTDLIQADKDALHLFDVPLGILHREGEAERHLLSARLRERLRVVTLSRCRH